MFDICDRAAFDRLPRKVASVVCATYVTDACPYAGDINEEVEPRPRAAHDRPCARVRACVLHRLTHVRHGSDDITEVKSSQLDQASS